VWRDERLHLLALGGSIAAGIAIRIALSFAAQGKHWSDSATIALMAMHSLRGKFYAFYWGQAYMGSLESLATVPFFALFGVSDVTLSMGLLPWYVLFAIALYLLVRRCGGPLAAVISGWLLALAPPYVQYQQFMPRGDYPETLAFGTWLLWLTLRVTHGELPPRSERRHLLAIGFVGGLAFWTNWLVFPYFAVAAIYLLLHDWRLPLRPVALVVLAFFFLGSLPFWVYNIRNGFPTFSFVEGVQGSEGRHVALEYALRGAIPVLFGFRDLDEKFTFGWPGRILTWAMALGLGALVVGLWRSWWALLRGRLRETHPVISLLLLMVAMVWIYAVGLPGRFHVARYLLPITTATLALTALAIAWLTARSRVLGGAALALLVVFYVVQIAQFRRALVSSPRPGVEGPVEELAEHLLRSGTRYGYADYGDSTITTYLTRDRVVLTDFSGQRYPLDEVDFHDPALILRESAGSADGTLASLRAAYSVSHIPGYRIYWPIRYDGIRRAPLPRRGWKVTASDYGADAPSMLDGDRWTYWSVPADGSSPTVTLDLGGSQTVTGIFFDLGERSHDGFTKLRIESSTDGSAWSLVEDAEWGFPVQFDPNGQPTTVRSGSQYVLVPPFVARALRFTCLERNEGYNWSIGELAVLGPGRDDVALRLPEFPDPTLPAIVERRLRLQSEREPENDRPLVELRRLYRSLGETAKLADVERIEAERFRPQISLGWRFGRDLKLVGYDWRVLGPRRLEVTYYWRAMRSMDVEYAAYVHFDGAGVRFQDDYLLGSPLGTRLWIPDEVVKQRRVISVPRKAGDGAYAAEIGVWVPQSRRHVRLGLLGLWGPRTRALFPLQVRGDDVTIESQER
jgi:hypothetical protein